MKRRTLRRIAALAMALVMCTGALAQPTRGPAELRVDNLIPHLWASTIRRHAFPGNYTILRMARARPRTN